MDIKKKREVKGAQGSAAAQYNTDGKQWYERACSFQYGAETSAEAIEAEKKENDDRFGVPHEFTYPDPAASNKDADATLPSPANFSNNPGFMGVSTGDMATSGNPANGATARVVTSGAPSSIRRSLPHPNTLGGRRETSGGVSGRAGTLGGSTIGRSNMLSRGNVTMPAPGDTDPGSEGGPQIVSSGFSNG
jgi:hypothetical protein